LGPALTIAKKTTAFRRTIPVIEETIIPFFGAGCMTRHKSTLPFRSKNLKWDLLFLAGTGALIASDLHISSNIPASGAHVSTVISNVGLYSTTACVAGLWLFGTKNDDSHARETGILALESFANTAGSVVSPALTMVLILFARLQRLTEAT